MDKEKYLTLLKSEIPNLAAKFGETIEKRVSKKTEEFIDNSKYDFIKWSKALANAYLPVLAP